MNEFQSAESGLEALTVPLLIYAVYGNSETLLTRPSSKAKLVLLCESGSFRVRPGDYVTRSSVAVTGNVFTKASHNYVSGDGPFLLSNIATITAVNTSTLYYVVKLTTSTFKLATSQAIALSEISNVTAVGTGTCDIGGMPGEPGGSITNGIGSIKIATGDTLVMNAPDKLTVLGAGAIDILTYYWLPSSGVGAA